MFRRMRMLRNWGGIVDVTPDRSPIIGKTPVPGPLRQLRLGHRRLQGDAGLRPRLRRHDRHGRAAPDQRALHARPLPHRPPDRRSGRRRRRALRTRHAADPLPLLRPAPGDRVPLRRRGAYRAARRPGARSTTRTGRSSSTSAPTRRALHAERWRHTHGCGRFFNARARHRHRPVPRDLQGRRAEAGRRRGRRA